MGTGHRAALIRAGVLFVAITAWKLAWPDPANGLSVLYVAPIALLGIRFGYRGGLAGAAIAMALTTYWAASHADMAIGSEGYLVRGLAFVGVAVAVAWKVKRMSALQAEADRWFSMSEEMCCVASFDGYFTRVNGAWTRWLGYEERDLLRQRFLDFVHPDDVERTEAETILLAGEPHATIDFENRYRAKDGTYHWLLWTARSDGDCIYSAARDITERKLLEAKLLALATEDKLTGLPNRRAWDARVADEAERASRRRSPLTVAIIDLDDLKRTNDGEGHAAGDRLLVGCAAAWLGAIREYDLLARLGGDEFGLLLPDCDRVAAGAVVERMRAATPTSSFSVGIAPMRDTATERCIARADEALYKAKAGGRGTTVTADP